MVLKFRASRGIRGVATVLLDGKPVGYVRQFGAGDWRAKPTQDAEYSDARGFSNRQAAGESLVTSVC